VRLAADRPLVSWARTPFSTLPMNWFGTEPPTTLSRNSKPEPTGSGSTSMSHTAYWPWPPDCLTCRPWPRALPPNVSRSATLTGSVSTSAPPARSRANTTSACASPMHHSTSWWVSALRSRRSVGSPATSRFRLRDRASSSLRVLATMATGSSGSGICHGVMSSGRSGADTVSPVSAEVTLVSAHTSPATQYGTSRRLAPSGE
jgi:hypothetical protein